MSQRIRTLYLRVLAMQAATLVALWLLQTLFGIGAS